MAPPSPPNQPFPALEALGAALTAAFFGALPAIADTLSCILSAMVSKLGVAKGGAWRSAKSCKRWGAEGEGRALKCCVCAKRSETPLAARSVQIKGRGDEVCARCEARLARVCRLNCGQLDRMHKSILCARAPASRSASRCALNELHGVAFFLRTRRRAQRRDHKCQAPC